MSVCFAVTTAVVDSKNICYFLDFTILVTYYVISTFPVLHTLSLPC